MSTHNHYVRDIVEEGYTDLAKDIPAWSPESLHIFENAEAVFEIGCELAWKEDNLAELWPEQDEASFDPRSFAYSSQEMFDIAMGMVYTSDLCCEAPAHE
jgi:hypothetical protein